VFKSYLPKMQEVHLGWLWWPHRWCTCRRSSRSNLQMWRL